MGELYKLTFPNGKCYIGITTVGAARRYAGHARGAAAGSKTKLYNAWRKHGAPALTTLAILEDGELAAAEARAVAAYETYGPRGYNSTPGGDVSPATTPEFSAKMRGNKNAVGSKHDRSLAYRAKLSLALAGNKNSVGNKHGLGNKNAAGTRGPEALANIRAGAKRRRENESLLKLKQDYAS